MSTEEVFVSVVGVLPLGGGAVLRGCFREDICQGESFCVVGGRVVGLNDTFL